MGSNPCLLLNSKIEHSRSMLTRKILVFAAAALFVVSTVVVFSQRQELNAFRVWQGALSAPATSHLGTPAASTRATEEPITTTPAAPQSLASQELLQLRS